jgi:hypothetical protein
MAVKKSTTVKKASTLTRTVSKNSLKDKEARNIRKDSDSSEKERRVKLMELKKIVLDADKKRKDLIKRSRSDMFKRVESVEELALREAKDELKKTIAEKVDTLKQLRSELKKKESELLKKEDAARRLVREARKALHKREEEVNQAIRDAKRFTKKKLEQETKEMMAKMQKGESLGAIEVTNPVISVIKDPKLLGESTDLTTVVENQLTNLLNGENVEVKQTKNGVKHLIINKDKASDKGSKKVMFQVEMFV